MAERAGWRLSRRLARIVLWGTLPPVFVAGCVGYYIVDHTVEREVLALLEAELDEVVVEMRQHQLSPALFKDKAELHSHQHPRNPMLWILWDEAGHVAATQSSTGAKWMPVPAALVSPDSAPVRTDRILSHSRRLHDDDAHVVSLDIDVSYQQSRVQNFSLVVVITTACCAAAAYLVARRVERSISETLRVVAASARSVRGPEQGFEVKLHDSPEEIRDVVEALREMLGNLRDESYSQRVFTAGVAHELRSPVQNLIGETEVALILKREPEAYRALLHSHLEELRGLGDAIDNLVTICSRRSASSASDLEDLDLFEEAQLRLRRERSTAERAGLRLDMAMRGNTRLRGDREELLRALRNLVQNALEWSPPGGGVRLMMDGTGREVVVTVEDDGPGIPEDLREQVFEPFYRGPSAQGRRIGYGLGLALARSAAHHQRGTIAVESAASGGALFRLVLPRDRSDGSA